MTKKQEGEKKKPIVLLDTHAILYRGYHALPDFRTPQGEPTGALYGLSMMLLSIINELSPKQIIACYDLPKKTHRHEAFEAYKAGRKPIDEELKEQIVRSRDIFTSFSIPMFGVPGFEADDLLGTFAEKLKKEGERVIIASGDMDTLQLVDGKKVQVYTLRKGIKDTTLLDEKAVVERYGFGPELIADYKGLRGDPSDNIPGVKGIGEKTATELITTFGTIEKIYEAVEKGEEWFVAQGFKKRIFALLAEARDAAEFSKLLATIQCNVPIEEEVPKDEWDTRVNYEDVEKLFDSLSFRSLVSRLPHKKVGKGTDVPEEEEIIDESATELNVRKAAIMLWLLDSTKTDATKDEVLRFTATNTIEAAIHVLIERLKNADLFSVYETIEEPLIPILARAYEHGILIDEKYLIDLREEFARELLRLEKEIQKQAGKEFNPSSSQQLAEVLFENLGIKKTGIKKTSTGRLSTAESELIKLVDAHPIIPLILRHRAVGKLQNTYVESLLEVKDEHHRVHTTLMQNGTTTGRFSSKDPNLQNIPIKSEEGRRIRNAFVAPEGRRLIAFDYSQIELRLAAVLSQDPVLIDIFKNRRDIHTEAAARIFEKDAKSVDPEERRKAKTINFAILYGMGVNALKASLGAGTTRDEAAHYLDQYFKTFSELALWIEKTKRETSQRGYTETLFGRRRFFPEIQSRVPFIRTHAERAAVNAPLQGTQADMIKIAMIRIHEFLKEKSLLTDAHLLLQIHDELIYEVEEELVKTLAPEIKKIMEAILPEEKRGEVPIITGAAAGKRMGELKDLMLS